MTVETKTMLLTRVTGFVGGKLTMRLARTNCAAGSRSIWAKQSRVAHRVYMKRHDWDVIA